uniref:hypothetical protein n=1 Tax=Micromonospora sp. NBC_00855 TaxID=2975978 RepID=UPI00224FC58D|nr:hypothetical protein OHB51_35350 [Micromonospora sp. NBC_00855]
MSITIPAELLTGRGPTITGEAILADLLEAARASRSRINLAIDTPLGRIRIPWKLPVPPPPAPPCPPSPIRATVLPALDEHQALVLERAVGVAIHGRWQLWGEDWKLRDAGENRCTRGDSCAWCAWWRDPSLETLRGFCAWSNPFLPEEFSW